jgi:ubiquinone/menaquinone biosynthesis C-methylase UbiE
VLELGGGTGKNTVWLAGQARSVTTLDFSAAMIARARDRVRAAHVTFVEHDLRQRWPVSEAAVDVVVANLVLEHIEHLKPIYAEAARVLRTGGEFFLCELHPERQRLGGRAEFTDKSGGTVQVAAYRHSVTEFLNEAIASGFAVCRVGEHLEDDAPRGASPRLFSAHFMKM